MSPRTFRRAPVRAVSPFLFGLLLAVHALAAPARLNGFDLEDATVARSEIKRGGPPRDGIPAIDNPIVIKAAQAAFLADDDRVLGLKLNGVARAYPIRILDWHEIVNDVVAGERVVVTYCPLCGSGTAFSATAAERPLRFGVSGLLYNSDLLLYDRETESLWPQVTGRAISGPLVNTELRRLAVSDTPWGNWRAREPDTEVLAPPDPPERDYRHGPYRGYAKSREIWFPVKFRCARYHPKERVLGLSHAGEHKAYPFVELGRASLPIEDSVGGARIVIGFAADSDTATAHYADGTPASALTLYWFAWYAFHPDTQIYRAPQD